MVMSNEESDKLRVQWQRWNKQCHPEDRIDWIEFLEEATNIRSEEGWSDETRLGDSSDWDRVKR